MDNHHSNNMVIYQIEIENTIKRKYTGFCREIALNAFKCIESGMGNSNECNNLLKKMRECKKKCKNVKM